VIVDCFTFYNELDLLEIRLRVLEGVVDRFVLCEAPFTFRGTPKPLYYAENAARFARWADRIVHLVYDAAPDADPWVNEWGQRAFLTTALAGLDPADQVLIGDVDEIPAPENLALRASPGHILVHKQRIAGGYFNRIMGEGWCGTRALAAGDLGGRSLNDIRFLDYGDVHEYVDGGWHLSSLGGAAVRADKFHTLSHAEADIPYYYDRFRLALEYASESGAFWFPLDDTWPAEFRDARWAHYVWPQPAERGAEAVRTALHAHGCYGSLPADATAIGALAVTEADVWRGTGTERFGAAFRVASTELADVLAAVPRGGWVVVDRIDEQPPAVLRVLCAAGLNVVGYAPNARSFAAVKAVLVDGEPFPSARAYGVAEIEDLIAASGYVIARRDGLAGEVWFAPSSLPATESFKVDIRWLSIGPVTHASLDALTATAAVYVLRPRVDQAGANTAATLSEL
jgi:hypothetical protein